MPACMARSRRCQSHSSRSQTQFACVLRNGPTLPQCLEIQRDTSGRADRLSDGETWTRNERLSLALFLTCLLSERLSLLLSSVR